MSAKELRAKTSPELKSQLLEEQEALFKLRMQRGSGQLPKPDQIRKTRRNIARLKTLLNEKTKGDN